ncbi:hypothetical protein TNCV_3875761 [Trichonephila clavipes]|uniref:Uncharacterized protein n=1 Tax=Trichonephila clavipes TaxID=2585209 RepID=A0A8X6T571_TRICX|nr:hypothetical protein TNCV_3875761 [Trichonephila clavipes]
MGFVKIDSQVACRELSGVIGMSATETYEMLKLVNGSDTMPRKQAYEWHRSFRESWESVEDDGRPQSSRNL